jgi:hypothetical protein
LLAVAGARLLPGRPETTLFAVCLPALALASGVLAAADPRRGVDERPLLVLTPLVLALAAAAWLAGAARLRVAAVVGTLVVLAALALPTLGKAPVARAAGISVISADGGSRAFLVAGILAAVAVGLLMLRILRGRPLLLAPALAILLLAGQAAAWSSVRSQARSLASSEPAPHGWVDRHAGDADVVVVGPADALDRLTIAELALWNRSIRGTRELNFLDVDPHSGQLGVDPEADLVLVRGTDLAGTPIARSGAGVLLRPAAPLNLAETIEGVYPDHWSAGRAVYRRFSGAPGVLRIAVSRKDVVEDVPPAEVIVASGPLQDSPEVRTRFQLRRGEQREVAVEVPEAGYGVVVTVTPTFQTADGRQVGAGLRFSYRPGQ